MTTTDFDDAPGNAPNTPAPGAMNPTLDQFRQQFTDPDARAWADETATRLDDYAQRKQMADAATAAGNNFVSNLDQFKSGLVNMVQSDPFAVDTALSLVRPTVGAMVGNVAGHPQDQLADQHDQISTHIEQTIAGAAVRSMAERHEDTARTMLDKVGGLLDDNDRQALDSYIGVQARARDLDAAAQQRQQTQQQQTTEDATAWNYLGAMVHPNTGQVQFPPQWAQRVLSDQRVGPQASAQLINTYGDLWKEGDFQSSNPLLVHDVAQKIASADPPTLSDVVSRISQGMKAADALTLATGTLPQSEAAKIEFSQLAMTLDTAKRTLAPPENGPAGVAAFERFTNWLLPLYRSSGPGILDPNSPDYLLSEKNGNTSATFWHQFAPRLTDTVEGEIPPQAATGKNPLDLWGHQEHRDTLRDLLGRRGPPVGDQVIRGRRTPPERMPTNRGVGELDEGGVPVNAGGFVNG